VLPQRATSYTWAQICRHEKNSSIVDIFSLSTKPYKGLTEPRWVGAVVCNCFLNDAAVFIKPSMYSPRSPSHRNTEHCAFGQIFFFSQKLAALSNRTSSPALNHCSVWQRFALCLKSTICIPAGLPDILSADLNCDH